MVVNILMEGLWSALQHMGLEWRMTPQEIGITECLNRTIEHETILSTNILGKSTKQYRLSKQECLQFNWSANYLRRFEVGKR